MFEEDWIPTQMTFETNSGCSPDGPVAKPPRSQCRRPRFNPWSGNWILLATR